MPPPAKPKIPKTAKAFADKARDLEALRTAVVDAAGVGAGLWLSYIFVLLYLSVAIGSVTHRDLFFESPIKLPFLNIELPLLGFFALGPLLFLVVHGYVLLHFVLLAGKVGAFHVQLKRQLEDQPEIREDLRRQLPSNIFVQFLAGPREVREGVIGTLLKVVAWISLVGGPVALLLFFLLQFLPYHQEVITNEHRAALVVDLALLWLLWPSVAGGRVVRLREVWSERKGRAAAMLALSLLVAVPAFTIATFPGEALYRPAWAIMPGRWDETNGRTWLSLHEPLREWLFEGEVDPDVRKPTSLWSNRLILQGLSLTDYAQPNTAMKVPALSGKVSLRKRDFQGAVLIDVVLREADLTAVRLQDAQLYKAELQGASLSRAQLQGASLVDAQLQGASLIDAQLQGASLVRAQLQGARLWAARLQGTSLIDAQLQGASLLGAQLQGASLDGAQLQGASLDRAQLQGASLYGVWHWRTILRKAKIGPTRTGGLQADPLSSKEFEELKMKIRETMLNGKQKSEALERISILNPAIKLHNEEFLGEAWAQLEKSPFTFDVFVKEVSEIWKIIACKNISYSYVIIGLLNKNVFKREDNAINLITRHRSLPVKERTAWKPHLADLAGAFLADNCTGARELTEDKKAFLKARPWE